MPTQTLDDLKQERHRRLRELAGMQEWMTGSLVETERVQGRSRKPFRYLSRSVGGRNSITYVAAAEVPRFRQCLATGARVRQLVADIAELSVAIVKAETRTRRTR